MSFPEAHRSTRAHPPIREKKSVRLAFCPDFSKSFDASSLISILDLEVARIDPQDSCFDVVSARNAVGECNAIIKCLNVINELQVIKS